MVGFLKKNGCKEFQRKNKLVNYAAEMERIRK